MRTSHTTTIWCGSICFITFNRGLCLALLLFTVFPGVPVFGVDLHAVIRDPSGAPVADAVVVAVPENSTAMEINSGTDIVDQIDRQFVPYVKAIVAGTSVSFPNKDNIRHHVYSFSEARRFELPLYSGVPADPVRFDTPGVVILGCNIHDWMIGYIYVSESPWFAVTDSEGRALIRGLPEGRYQARSWHPLMEINEKDTAQAVDLGSTPAAELNWVLKLKPDIRPRRAPVGGVRGYR